MRLWRISLIYSFLFLLMLLNISASSALYGRGNREYLSQEYDCNYPLEACTWGLQLHGGVYPIVWTKRANSFIVNCTGAGNIDSGKFGNFNHFYKVPWVVGGQISYAYSCNTNVFVEFNYARSSGTKCPPCTDVLVNPLAITLTKYALYSGYVGARYYFDRWCNRVSPFFGFKLGAVHHKRVRFETIIATTDLIDYTDTTFFAKNTVLSGGAHIGLDICGWCGLNFVITGEVVANCGPHFANHIALSNADAARLNGFALLPGNIHTELAFPVTLGIKYNF